MSAEKVQGNIYQADTPEATLYGGRFYVAQPVEVVTLAEIGDPADEPWVVCGDPIKGVVLPEPTAVPEHYRDHIQVMPDVSLPVGEHYGTGHPILVAEEPYKVQLTDGQYVSVRTMVRALIEKS